MKIITFSAGWGSLSCSEVQADFPVDRTAVQVESPEEALTVMEKRYPKGGPYCVLGRGPEGFVLTDSRPDAPKTLWLRRGGGTPRHITNVYNDSEARALTEALYGNESYDIVEGPDSVTVTM